MARFSLMRSLARRVGAAVAGVFLVFIALEGLVRLRHRNFVVESRLPVRRTTTPRASYDSLLGWVPRPGYFAPGHQEPWTVLDGGLRGNGAPIQSTRQPILTLGDSFTFGDEVGDADTWPAQLQRELETPVLNGGVFAYGVDQAYLRGMQLLREHQPGLVLLAFISDDVARAEFSHYYAWKPYYEYSEGGLTLRNVPVPTGEGPQPHLGTLRKALSYSLFASAVLPRIAHGWWYHGFIERKHRDGEAVTVELLVRLDEFVRSKGARFVVITLATNGRIGDDQRVPGVADGARRRGVEVLDLQPEISELASDSTLFMPAGHYGPALNGLVASRIARYVASNVGR